MDSQPESVTSTLIRIARSLFGNPSRNVVNPVVTNVTGEEAGPIVVHCNPACWILAGGLTIVNVIFAAMFVHKCYRAWQRRGRTVRRISYELNEETGEIIPYRVETKISADGSGHAVKRTMEGDIVTENTVYLRSLVRKSIARRNSSFLRKIDEEVSMIEVEVALPISPQAAQSPPGKQQIPPGSQSDVQLPSLNAPTTSGVGAASSRNRCKVTVQCPSTSAVNSVIFPRGADIIIVHTPPGTSPVGSPERRIDAGPSPLRFPSTSSVIVVNTPPEESEHNMSSPVSTENRSEIASGNSEVPTPGAPRVSPETSTLEGDSRENPLNSPERDIEAATPAKD